MLVFSKRVPEFAIISNLIGSNEIQKVVSFGESVGSYLLTPITLPAASQNPIPENPHPPNSGVLFPFSLLQPISPQFRPPIGAIRAHFKP